MTDIERAPAAYDPEKRLAALEAETRRLGAELGRPDDEIEEKLREVRRRFHLEELTRLSQELPGGYR